MKNVACVRADIQFFDLTSDFSEKKGEKENPLAALLPKHTGSATRVPLLTFYLGSEGFVLLKIVIIMQNKSNTVGQKCKNIG
jgi:hypothetical protein